MNMKIVGHNIINFDQVTRVVFAKDPKGIVIATIWHVDGKNTGLTPEESDLLAAWAKGETSGVVPLTPAEGLTEFPPPPPRGTHGVGFSASAY